MSITQQNEIDIVDSTLFEEFKDKLQSVFTCAFEIWPATRAEQIDKTKCSGPEPAAKITDSTGDHAFVQKLSPGEFLLFIPLERAGVRNAVAAGLMVTESPNLLIELANSLLDNCQLQSENDELVFENNGFVRQVTADLEELTFLRQIADRLKVTDASTSVSDMATTMLGLVNYSVKAESLALFCFPKQRFDRSNPQPRKLRRAALVGDSNVSDEQMLALIDMFQSEQLQPEVVNYLGAVIKNHGLGEVNSFILVPVVGQDELKGWILALNRIPPTAEELAEEVWDQSNREFGSCEATLLESAASMLASQMLNTELLAEKEDLLTQVVRTLVSAIEAKDEYTCGHSERVALFGRRLAALAGFDEETQERIYFTGLLHDIGKIAVPDAILGKTGRLTPEEFAEVKKHPEIGWSILSKLEQLSQILPGVLHHHERMDGRGYPDQLTGTEIPLDGRVLAIADTFDAMTSDRPYRNGMSVERAINIIHAGAGTQWDRELVRVFLQSINDFIDIKENHESGNLMRRVRNPSPTTN